MIGLPSANARKLKIRLRVPACVRLTEATVTLNGKRVKRLTGSKLRTPVELKLPRGRAKLGVTVKLADGRSVKVNRTYRGC